MIPEVPLEADMSIEEVKVLLALEGHVAPFHIQGVDRMFYYATIDDLISDFEQKVWWKQEVTQE